MSSAHPTLPSPCRDICIFDAATGWCVGCCRTLRECKLWKTTPRRELRALSAKLPRRLAALEDQTYKFKH